MYKKKDRYSKLNIDFDVPDDVEMLFDRFVDYLNTSDGMTEDCYRTEIKCALNQCHGEISDENIERLKNYYVWGGIYE